MQSIEELIAEAENHGEFVVGKVLELVREKMYRLGIDMGVMAKPSVNGNEDFVTVIDFAAQELFLHWLLMLTPTFGVIAEEDSLHIPCTVEGHDVYWTIDPVDGTKALVRHSSNGIGIMLALVVDGNVVFSCIADVSTQEVYVFGTKDGAWRKRPLLPGAPALVVPLGPSPKPLCKLASLFGQYPQKFSAPYRALIAMPEEGGLFNEMEVDRGSIGIRMAKLWKGEVGGYLVRPFMETPWDNTPLVGFNKKLGFLHLRHDPASDSFVEYEPVLPREPYNSTHEALVIHALHLPELRAWEAARKK